MRPPTLILAALLVATPAGAEVVGGRPAGCPTRYCGCGAALHIFGHHVRQLWLARNWLKFPRAEPAPGMAVVRSGHVAVIIGGGQGAWLMKDYNSGRGLTRIHVRPIFGAVVNPNAPTSVGNHALHPNMKDSGFSRRAEVGATKHAAQ